jgi:hypothetical protein
MLSRQQKKIKIQKAFSLLLKRRFFFTKGAFEIAIS